MKIKRVKFEVHISIREKIRYKSTKTHLTHLIIKRQLQNLLSQKKKNEEVYVPFYQSKED